MIEIYFDGACWPNPGGTAGCGWVIKKSGNNIATGSLLIGTGSGMTNNVAEYKGLIEGVKNLSSLGIKDGEIKIYGDSKLICSMVSRTWGKKSPHKKAPHLKTLLDEALVVLASYKHQVNWIARELNSEADEMSTKPLIEAGVKIQPHYTKTITSTDNLCPTCSKYMVERKGPYGKFYGCSTYPKCKGIKKIEA